MLFRQFFAAIVLATVAAGVQASDDWTFAVSEGTSGGIDGAEVLSKYGPLAQLIQKATGHKLRLILAREFDRLEASTKAGEYEFVMARPSDYPARAVRDYGYQMVSTMKPDGHCYIVVPKDSPLKSLQQLKGRSLLLPEKAAYMTKFCSAELRDRGIDVKQEKVTYMREQEGVAWAVAHGLADAGGLASYSGNGKNWEKNGGRLLHVSVAQPYFPLVASARVPAADVEKIRDALRQAAQTEDGAKMLARMGVEGFNIEDRTRLLRLLDWLN